MDTENRHVDVDFIDIQFKDRDEMIIKTEDVDGHFMTLVWAVDLLGRCDNLSGSDNNYLLRLTDLLDQFNR